MNLLEAGGFQRIWSVEPILWVFTKDDVKERRSLLRDAVNIMCNVHCKQPFPDFFQLKATF